jgi:hypothetical protein
VKLFFYCFMLLSNVVKVPENLISQGGASQATRDGKSQWTAEWDMKQSQDGKRTVRFVESGVGDLGSFSKDARWTVDAAWLAESAFTPLDIQRTVTALDGTPLLVETKHFDQAQGVVRFERRKGNGRLETSTLSIPPDTLAIEGLAGILRFVPFDDRHPFDVHVLSNEPRVYSVTFEWRGNERVKTPAGEFDCYKIEMVPHLGVGNVFRPFLTKTFFWFTVAPPHYWIRYTGPESGPDSRSIVMELTRNTR